jgi:hypothetical protein
MTPSRLATSAALFYSSKLNSTVPLSWLSRALKVFDEHRLSPILFTAGGGPFERDDCYLLADRGPAIYKWGDPCPILPRRAALIEALQSGTVYSLSLDAPRADSKDRSEWRTKLSASSVLGKFYIGLESELQSDLSKLICRACEIADGLFDVRYGFAYVMPLDDDPASYSSGSTFLPLSKLEEWLHRRERTIPPIADEDLWQDELSHARRHLNNCFRGAYRANVLSTSHVEAADLRSFPVGKLSQIDSSLWLWELSDSEMPIAETMLRAKRLLIGR